MWQIVDVMNKYQLRSGADADQEWLYRLYCQTMRPSIDATWGWDEAFQRKEFSEDLAPESWQIIVAKSQDIGGFVLKDKPDHLWLEMLIIKPKHQKNGVGLWAIDYMKKLATEISCPLKLSVIKLNPVKPFYLKLGFKQYYEDKAFYKLVWYP